MNSRLVAVLAVTAVIATPAFAVESIYLDSVPVTNPGEYLAPENFYMQVPPPTMSFGSAGTLAPATLFDFNVMRPYYAAGQTSNSLGYSGYALSSEAESDSSGEKLRVLIKAGLDHASDVPLAVLREHFAEAENIELVGEGKIYDVLVEVETMKPASSATVFIVVNAYKEVDDESLIFYNTFGYLGELKLLSGSSGYATNLERALTLEAERLQE